jgi:hypothetical protein
MISLVTGVSEWECDRKSRRVREKIAQWCITAWGEGEYHIFVTYSRFELQTYDVCYDVEPDSALPRALFLIWDGYQIR